jgi:hydroxyethylthiazole kinase-like uncharacterized protein yjeF
MREVTLDYLRENPLPQPDEAGDKEGRGRVLVIGGSLEVPGAALLAGTAALRAGCGKLQIATCRSIAPHLGLALPEALVAGLPETAGGGIDPACAPDLAARAARCNAVLLGPGMMDEDAVAALVGELLVAVQGPAFVVDAGALTGLRDRPEVLRNHAGRLVLTPHAGEMAAYLGITKAEVADDPVAAARQAAASAQCVVAMKGACTYIVSPQGEAWSSRHGNVGLATSGSGDTLAGIIAGLLARGVTPVQATIWGVYLHAEAGNRLSRSRGTLGFLARELLAEVPAIMADMAGPA